jgi:hypothetical protein
MMAVRPMPALPASSLPPRAEPISARGATFVVETWADAVPRRRLVFLHGWGQTRQAMAPLASGFLGGEIGRAHV